MAEMSRLGRIAGSAGCNEAGEPCGAVKEDREALIKACAGKLEGADALTRIAKETEEEIGIRLAAAPRHVFTAYSSPGSYAESLHYFVTPYAAEDRVSTGGGLVEGGEDIAVIETTLDAAVAMIERGAIVDAKTIWHGCQATSAFNPRFFRSDTDAPASPR